MKYRFGQGIYAEVYQAIVADGVREGSLLILSVSKLTASNLQMLLH